jgi:bifunctional NMN adenylyltransferase/nudix hydrolase
MYDILVFIGRFQPFHVGHIHVVNQALASAKKVVVLVGSSNVSRSPRNPFTFEEREQMILNAYEHDAGADRLSVHPLNDMADDDAWISQVQAIVAAYADTNGIVNPTIGLIGHAKDGTSYYLKKFPMWGEVRVDNLGDVNATTIRTRYFMGGVKSDQCHPSTNTFLSAFAYTEEFEYVFKWMEYDEEYDPKEHPVQVLCADNVVVQSGHILLVTRKEMPGQGLLALPGGHVNPDETFLEAAIRELREETKICDSKGRIPPAILRSYIVDKEIFDDPNRSSRARVATIAYHYKLPDARTLMGVVGDDDAEKAEWHALGSLDPTMMFEDHAKIIEHFLGNVFGN